MLPIIQSFHHNLLRPDNLTTIARCEWLTTIMRRAVMFVHAPIKMPDVAIFLEWEIMRGEVSQMNPCTRAFVGRYSEIGRMVFYIVLETKEDGWYYLTYQELEASCCH